MCKKSKKGKASKNGLKEYSCLLMESNNKNSYHHKGIDDK
jgi:hypothetical protein